MRTLCAALLLAAGCFSYNPNGFDRDGGGADAPSPDALGVPDASPPASWLVDLGATMDQSGTSLVLGRGGAIFVGGTFDGAIGIGGTVLTSAGSTDFYVARLEAEGGTHVWVDGFGSTRADGAPKLAVDAAGDLLVVGSFQGTMDLGGHTLTAAGGVDGFAAKLSAADGSVVWARQWGGSGIDRGGAIASDASGDVFVTGTFSATVDLGDGPVTSAGMQDLFVAKYSSSGNEFWVKHFGSAGDDAPFGVAVDSTGAVIVAGSIGGSGTFGTTDPLASRGGADILLAKYRSSDGAGVWAFDYGGAGDDRATGVTVGSGDAIFVTGAFTGDGDLGGGTIAGANATTTDAFVARYDASGVFGWAKTFGAAKDDRGEGIAVGGGAVLVAGWFQNTVDFGMGPLAAAMDDGFVVALSTTDGATEWARSFGGPGNDAGRAVAFDSTARTFVTGDFSGMCDFGPMLGIVGAKGGLDAVAFAFSQ